MACGTSVAGSGNGAGMPTVCYGAYEKGRMRKFGKNWLELDRLAYRLS
ncbi:hypothetical protein A2U01_0065797, partial [Trifolium medium]|nr:hypothetical protein [Trifolium medium]